MITFSLTFFFNLLLLCLERFISTPHGSAGWPCGVCQTPAAAQGTCWWCHTGLPDSPPCCCSLWSLQSYQTFTRQESQPECSSIGTCILLIVGPVLSIKFLIISHFLACLLLFRMVSLLYTLPVRKTESKWWSSWSSMEHSFKLSLRYEHRDYHSHTNSIEVFCLSWYNNMYLQSFSYLFSLVIYQNLH